MPRIKIEIEVPDNDCDKCEKSYLFYSWVGKECTQFQWVLERIDGKYQRCQECLDATVDP